MNYQGDGGRGDGAKGDGGLDAFRARLGTGDLLLGTFLGMGSSISSEVCGLAGFDWVLIDLEHGSGSDADLLHQLQALAHTPATPFVRVESLTRERFVRALDLGAQGIMVPMVNTRADAERAAANLRYPPTGTRGVALLNRALGYGIRPIDAGSALSRASLGIAQIETEEAVRNAYEIAGVDGIDVLFVGPSDLTHSMGIFGQRGDERFLEALAVVAAAAKAHGKTSGTLLSGPGEANRYLEMGFSFLGVSSDLGMLARLARETVEGVRASHLEAGASAGG
jgi:4-hydroxy-2-oxoheptanedioate aldolase